MRFSVAQSACRADLEKRDGDELGCGRADASAARGGFAAAAKLHASTVLSSLSNASFATLCVYARLERRHFSFYTWDHVAGQCDLPRRSFRLKVHLRCSFAALSTLNEY